MKTSFNKSAPDSVKIREATLEDLDFIYSSLRNLAEEENLLERFVITKEELAHALFENKIAKAVLAVENKEACGLILYSMTHRNFTFFDKPGLYIHDLYVWPAYRRKGIATQLKERLKTLAKAQGYGRIDFVVLKQNASAIQLYDSWTDTQEVDYLKYMRIKL